MVIVTVTLALIGRSSVFVILSNGGSITSVAWKTRLIDAQLPIRKRGLNQLLKIAWNVGELFSVECVTELRLVLGCCFFFRWDISVICLTVVLKLAVTVTIRLYFQTFWPNWLNLFSKKIRSITEKNRFPVFFVMQTVFLETYQKPKLDVKSKS